jgi:hypothetical protein
MSSIVDPEGLRDELLARVAAVHEPAIAELRAARGPKMTTGDSAERLAGPRLLVHPL